MNPGQPVYSVFQKNIQNTSSFVNLLKNILNNKNIWKQITEKIYIDSPLNNFNIKIKWQNCNIQIKIQFKKIMKILYKLMIFKKNKWIYIKNK